MPAPGPLLLLLALACGPAAPLPDPSLDTTRPEDWRPQVHFSPAEGWMNDPCGLVWFEGEWHLFFQHNPDAPLFGAMSWGHAVSPDLVRWTELPVAISPDETLGWAWSGSAVVERAEPSAVCDEVPCLVAAFTHRDGAGGTERQSLASSTDQGRTFALYPGDPVLENPGVADFRDPRVFPWEDGWRMVLASGGRVEVYGSPDLVGWTHLGRFEPGGLPGELEMPDLFPLPVTGVADTRWVLVAGLTAGGPQGGSGTAYWTGAFDGTTFTPDAAGRRWLDHGPDLYAAQTWSEAPDDRRVLVGWANNWDYALVVPTLPWRGAQALPRALSLVPDGEQVRLVQAPVGEVATLRAHALADVEDVLVEEALEGVSGRALDLDLDLDAGDAEAVVLGFFGGAVELAWDVAGGRLTLDRSDATGGVDALAAPLEAEVGPGTTLDLRVLVDWSSVEVFADGGRVALTALVLPHPDGSAEVALAARGGEAVATRAEAWALSSIWAASD